MESLYRTNCLKEHSQQMQTPEEQKLSEQINKEKGSIHQKRKLFKQVKKKKFVNLQDQTLHDHMHDLSNQGCHICFLLRANWTTPNPMSL